MVFLDSEPACTMNISWTMHGHCDPYACKQKITKDGSAVRIIYFVTVEGQFTSQAQAGRQRKVLEAKKIVFHISAPVVLLDIEYGKE